MNKSIKASDVKKSLAACATTVLFLAASLQANSQTTNLWNSSNGSWGNTANWSLVVVADGIDNWAQTANPGGGRTITLDGDRLIGNLDIVVNNNRSYTINAGTPSTSTLTLDVSSGTPVVQVRAGSTAGVLNMNVPVLGSDGLEKRGVGLLNLAAVNLYTGATIMTAGNLAVNGSLAAGSAVQVNGGTFGGAGTINGSITLNSGGTINPGNIIQVGTAPAPQIGVLTAASLTWNGGGTLAFQLGTSPATSDLLNLSGVLTKGTAGVFNFAFSTNSAGFSLGTFTLITFPSSSGFSESDFTFSGPPEVNGVFALNPTSLEFTAIPEPTSAMLAVIGMALMWQLHRRKS
jgi:hypothetical protein